ncbi:response regulator transcription factor [Bifidobacterium vespertilionis]|uniref:response regulator transcription factor n=1 Tax=Bifidobacterium vespertilionis TaxID=2562524 RepID=UPI001BDBF0A0|nr:response regulator transcription factor [Bifidobacterium vespertilionis]MBT1180306.1 response regulator transcription factor [Bifidobacterium vespertilionis]
METIDDPTRLLKAKILLIEDDERLGAITKELLDDDYRVTWVTDGSAGRSELATGSYDAAIIDRRLPDMDGLELVRMLRARGVSLPVLMLTALSSVEDIVAGLDDGANDYVTKPFQFAELDARLRVLLRGSTANQRSYAIGDWTFLAESEEVERFDGTRIRLTAAESALLRVLCASPEHVFSRQELLAAAFHPDDVLGTIDTYVSYIRQKTTKGLIITVRGRGYRIGAPEE